MKHWSITLLLFLTTTMLLSQCLTEASFCDPSGQWRQVFADEFDGTTLDTKKWSIVTGFDIGLSREAYLLPENVYLDGKGSLILATHKNVTEKYNYTSGAIISKDKAYFQYGRVCVSAKLPGNPTTNHSNGIWPAHWMMPNDASCWPDNGEIDILEMIDGDGFAYGTYHWSRYYPSKNCTGGDGNTQVGNRTTVSHWWDQYHEYSMEWDADYVNFYVDGLRYNHVNASSKGDPGGSAPIFSPVPFYVLLNTAVGGPWPRPVDVNTTFPVFHTIDYVRVAQKASHLAFVGDV